MADENIAREAARETDGDKPLDPKAAWDALPEDRKQALRQREAARLYAAAAEHQSQGRLDDAVAGYTRAIALNPGFGEAYNNLGVILRRTGKLAAAAACYRRAHGLNERDSQPLTNLGNVLRDMGRFGEAVSIHQQAVRVNPASANAVLNLGLSLRDAGAMQSAIGHFDRAGELDPDGVSWRVEKAVTQLLAGDLAEGFAGMEARHALPGYTLRGDDKPAWDGSELKGKTVLIQAEQSLNDILQFARYLPLVKAKGGNTVLEAPEVAADLLSTVRGVDKVILTGAKLPRCDFQVAIGSLPHVLGISDPAQSADVYLSPPDPGKLRLPPQGGSLRVGITWGADGGNGTNTRVPGLAPLLDLTGIRGATFFALQRGPAQIELETLGADALMADLSRGLADLGDAACVIDQMDLVITADNAIAHVAGAMGKPTWVMIPAAPDWRWGRDADETPWYPSMRLFRAPEPGKWDAPASAMRKALRTLMRERSASS